MASAEERQLGTAEWQILLPMPAWQQWALKAGVSSRARRAAGGCPARGSAISRRRPERTYIKSQRAWREITGIVVILTSLSLYLSTLCTSGVRALVLTLPTIVAAFLFVRTVGDAIGRVLFRLVHEAGWRSF